MALQGTLDTFALPDVLRLLAATKKTGRLRMTSERGDGSLWVDGGSLSAIEASHAPAAVEPVDALFELLRFEEGSFTFDTDAGPDASGTAHDVEELLGAAGALLAEWRELEAVVPSLDAWVTLRPSLHTPEVTISQHHWATLVVVGAGVTVREMGEHLDLSELPVSRSVRDLVELGVVDVSSDAPIDHQRRPGPERDSSGVDHATADPVPPVGAGEADPAAMADARPALDEMPIADEVAPQAAPDPWALVEGPTDAEGDAAPLPTARPIRARRARGSSRPAPDPLAPPERFVPLELPGRGAGDYDPVEPAMADAAGPALDVDDLAAAFPGLAHRTAEHDSDDDLARQLAALPPEVAEAVRAAAEASTEEEAEAVLDEIDDDEAAPLNRGLLLKLLSSVRG